MPKENNELKCPNCGRKLSLISRDIIEGVAFYFIHEGRLEYKRSEPMQEDMPYCPECMFDLRDFLKTKGIEFD